nr:Chain F, Inosine monophosphate dehydrogenase-related protein [Vibrio sp.]
YMTLQAVTF